MARAPGTGDILEAVNFLAKRRKDIADGGSIREAGGEIIDTGDGNVRKMFPRTRANVAKSRLGSVGMGNDGDRDIHVKLAGIGGGNDDGRGRKPTEQKNVAKIGRADERCGDRSLDVCFRLISAEATGGATELGAQLGSKAGAVGGGSRGNTAQHRQTRHRLLDGAQVGAGPGALEVGAVA